MLQPADRAEVEVGDMSTPGRALVMRSGADVPVVPVAATLADAAPADMERAIAAARTRVAREPTR